MASDPSTAAQRIMAYALPHLGSFFKPARTSPNAGCDSITWLILLTRMLTTDLDASGRNWIGSPCACTGSRADGRS